MTAPDPPDSWSGSRSDVRGVGFARGTGAFWGTRNVLLLLVARSVSVAGDWLFNIAVVWLVLQTTHSAGMVAAVAITQAIPFVVFGVFYAGLLDRVRSRRRALVLLDAARALIVLTYPMLDRTGLLNPVTLLLVTLVLGAANAVFTPGLQALLPQVLAHRDLPRGHAMLDVTQRVGRILGPGLSGLLLLLVTTSALFYIDAASCVVSAAGLVGLTVHAQRPRPRDGPPRAGGPLAELRASVHYLRAHRVSRRLIAVRTAQNSLWAVYTVGLPVLVYRSLGQAPGVFGLLIGVYAVGQLLGNVAAVRLHGYAHPLRNLHWGWLVCGAGYVTVGLTQAVGPVALGLAISGIGSAVANIGGDGYLAVATDPGLQGRVFTLQSTGMTLAQVLGTAFFGAILEMTPPEGAFTIAGIAMMAVAAFSAMRRPDVRR